MIFKKSLMPISLDIGSINESVKDMKLFITFFDEKKKLKKKKKKKKRHKIEYFL